MYIIPQPYKCPKGHETTWPLFHPGDYGEKPWCRECKRLWRLEMFPTAEDPNPARRPK